MAGGGYSRQLVFIKKKKKTSLQQHPKEESDPF